MKTHLLRATAVVALASGFMAEAAVAQTITLEEITVTAQRREQSLLDVPISVTAFTAQMIERANIEEAKDYLSFTPNVSFTEGGEVGNRSVGISIRGVSNVSLGEVSTQNSIGYYIDDLNVGSVASGVINPQLQDMERIEVLRGPQGTFFGRNASGGALNISTNKPSEELDGYAAISYGRFGTWGLEGMMNAPLSDNVFVRVVGGYDESNGHIKNLNPNGTPNSGYEYAHVRGSLRALLSDSLTLDFSVTYTDEDEGMDDSVGSGVLDLDTESIWGTGFPPMDEGQGYYPENKRYVNHDAKEYNKNQVMILNNRLTWEGEGITLKSITGYIDSDNARFFDQDNISADVIVRENEYSGKSFSQEFRAQSNGDGPLAWTVGAIYAHDKINQFNSVRAGSEPSYTHPVTGEVFGLLPPIPEGFRINENYRRFKTESYGLFADASYELTEQFTVTVGGRYTHDKITNTAFGVVAFEAPIADQTGSGSFNDFSPRVVLSYKATEDMSVYASASKGYKAGGVDVNSGVVTEFDPETLWNYELGFKADLADGAVRVSGAVFYLDWKDLQVQTNYLLDPTDISSAVEKTLNAAKASNAGAEFEVQAALAEGLQVAFNVGYLDSEFDTFPNAILAGGNAVNLTGQRLPNTPEWTVSSYVDYQTPITDDLEAYGRLEWTYRSKTMGDLEAVAAPVLGLGDFPYIAKGYNVVNLRMGVQNDRYEISGYVENLFDEDYYNATSDNFGLAGIRLRPHPREWGVKLKIRM